MSTTVKIDTWTLSYRSEPIEVTSFGPRRDPSWRHDDANGHLHVYDGNGGTPTLRWVVDEPGGTYVDDDGYVDEYPDEGHHECILCGDPVEPGMRGPSVFREFIPGPTYCTIESDAIVCNVSHEQFVNLIRRLSMTRDRSIWAHIIGKFVDDHPEQVTSA